MKKLFAILLAVALVAALAVVASADPITTLDDQTINVNGTFVGYTEEAEYNLTIGWGTMSFTYTEATEQWDEVAHKWIPADEAAWAAAGNTITLKNDSSVDVEAEFSFDTDVANLVAEFTCDDEDAFVDDVLTMEMELNETETATYTATTYTVTVTLSGDVEFDTGVIGEITIALS